MSTLSELKNQIGTLIDDMPTEFNTHDFIKKFAQAHQRAYIEALYDYKDNARPFNALHQQIGKMLKQEFSEKLTHIRDSNSPDIFGNEGQCAVWQQR
jgi:hypothetical protein